MELVDSGCILDVEMIGLADRLDMEGEVKRKQGWLLRFLRDFTG